MYGIQEASGVWGQFGRPGAVHDFYELKPGLLVIYHRSNMGATPGSADSEDVLLSEIKDRYKGRVVAGHDLDVF